MSRAPIFPTDQKARIEATVKDLYREAEHYRSVFNHIRPRQALGMRRPIEILTDPLLHPIHKHQTEDLVPEA